MNNPGLVKHALKLLQENPDYVRDAREGAPIGNSIIGCIMSHTTGSPRWATEAALEEALEIYANANRLGINPTENPNPTEKRRRQHGKRTLGLD